MVTPCARSNSPVDRREVPTYELQQAGFPGAVLPDQSNPFPSRHPQRHLTKDDPTVKRDGRVLDANQTHAESLLFLQYDAINGPRVAGGCADRVLPMEHAWFAFHDNKKGRDAKGTQKAVHPLRRGPQTETRRSREPLPISYVRLPFRSRREGSTGYVKRQADFDYC